MIGDVMPKSQEAKRLDAQEGSGGGGSVIDSHGNIVGGENNIIPDSASCKDNLAVGDGNEFRSTTQGNIVGGWHNILAWSNYNLCLGHSNYLHSAYDALVAGIRNDVSSSNSITVGEQLNNAVNYCLMIGKKATSSGTDRIVVGDGTSTAQRRTFRVEADGTTYAKVYNTIGADYAEYFEWADGNPDGEDRRGLLVKLVGDKIAAAHGDEILGAVSARPSVIGNACEEHWHGKYKTDIYGDYILDDDGKPQLSDDYDPEREYIPRSKRREWATVGMVGRLIIRDNGKCEPGGYVSARQGIGVPTYKETKICCLKRLDDTHIEVLIR